MAQTAYIYDAIRTPRSKGKKDGSLHEVKPYELGAGLLSELQQRYDLDTSKVDDVVMGCVTPIGEQGSDIARTVVMAAGWDELVPGVQLDRFCGSGLEAVNTCAAKVASGWENLMVAGGVESMSRLPIGSNGGALFSDPDICIGTPSVPQGVSADLIATLDGKSREDVDGFALESQKRAAHARDNGYFDKSVVPVRDRNGVVILDKDDFIKPGTTMEVLGGLKASFEQIGAMGFDEMALSKYAEVESINHVHTPGNSSGIVDGASAVLIGNEQAGRDHNMTPRARIVSIAALAADPTIMLTAPGPAAKKCLDRAGLSVADIDLFEINEAFASVALRFMSDLNIGHEITNVNGGAIAMGHPLGATGAMLVGIMLDELERRNLKRGLVSLCIGGGQGIATVIERV